jgi:hypothetical protein
MGWSRDIASGCTRNAPKEPIACCKVKQAARLVTSCLVHTKLDSNMRTAFEGTNHPYKNNILTYPGQDVKPLIKELPDPSKQEWLGKVKI